VHPHPILTQGNFLAALGIGPRTIRLAEGKDAA